MSYKFDRNKFLIGAYYFNENVQDDKHIEELIDCGIDFLVSAANTPSLYPLCEKHNIGIMSHSNYKMWWGGDGDNAGKYHEVMSFDEFEQQSKEYKDSPILWGDYLVDEPNAKDFKHINEIIKKYCEKYPDNFPYINLYPNYASVPTNNDEETVSQLGNATYAEHIEQYVKEIDLDYICYDFYPYTGRPFDTYIENFDIVAKACRKYNKDMWVIIQTGAWKIEDILDEYQIRWQSNLCLAYGTRLLMHASYCKGWWDENTSCVNLKGEKNVTFDYAKHINEEIHALGDIFMKYTNTGVYVNGNIEKSHERIRPQLYWQNDNLNGDILNDNIKINADGALLTGYFKDVNGNSAVMIVNTNNPYCKDDTVNVELDIKTDIEPKYYIDGKEITPDNKQLIALNSGSGLFIEF